MARGACACEPFFWTRIIRIIILGRCAQNLKKNLFKNLSLPILLGMRYAQKFFRINYKFYKFLFGVATLKIFRKSFWKSFTFFWTRITRIVRIIFSCLYLRMVAHDLLIKRISFWVASSKSLENLFENRLENLSKIVWKIFHFIILKNLFLICQISARRASENLKNEF